MTSFGGTTLTNGYRGDSLRGWKQNSTGRTYFLYSGTQLVCELSTTGAVAAANTVGPNGLISRHTSNGSIFYAFDTHGSVCQRLSSSGSVLSTQTFDAYGSRLSTDGNADPYAGYGGQSGYYTDWEAGTVTAALELLTFRYYDPSAGRFLTRDPIGYKGGTNPYEYVSNGPTNDGDSIGLGNGLIPIPIIGGIASGVIGCLLATAAYNNSDNTGCEANYNLCIMLGHCAASIAAGAIETAVSTFCTANPALALMGPCLEGAAEGAASAILNAGVDAACQNLNPCPEKFNGPCFVIGLLMETMGGCVAGGILGEEAAPVKTLISDVLVKLGAGGMEAACASATHN